MPAKTRLTRPPHTYTPPVLFNHLTPGGAKNEATKPTTKAVSRQNQKWGHRTNMKTCPFCEILESGRHETENGGAAVIKDRYPVTPGHTLIIPKRHVTSFTDLTTEETQAVTALINQKIVETSQQDKKITGWNTGFNLGESAGQTVPHIHCHLIPRRKGDCKDPRGGIRWIFPEKANYWDKPTHKTLKNAGRKETKNKEDR